MYYIVLFHVVFNRLIYYACLSCLTTVHPCPSSLYALATCSESEMATSDRSSVVDFDTEISILDIGVKFSYIDPSFSVLHVDLRQIKYLVTAGLTRADPSLEDRETPYSVRLKDFCFVPVSECNCKRECSRH